MIFKNYLFNFIKSYKIDLKYYKYCHQIFIMELLNFRSLSILNQPITEDNFEDAEKELAELCKEFFNKWENKVGGVPPLEKQSLQNFVSDTKYVFKQVYKVYGCPALIQEMNNALHEEDNGPDEEIAKDIAEHTNFLKNIKCVLDCNEISEFENDYSKVCVSLKESNNYLKKKQQELHELINSMKELNDKLETVTKLMGSYLEQNQ